MRKMKDSGIEWIGMIPKNVNILRNKYLISYVKGKLPANINTEKEGIPYIGASDLEDLSGNCTYTSYTTDTTLPLCSEEDVLILWDGARAGLIGTNHKGAVASTVVNAIPKHTINKKFWYWYLKAFQTHLYNRVNGTTIPHMNTDYIEEIAMLDWTIEDQEKIAAYLDKKCAEIDAIIAAKEKTNELLKERRQSIIYEAVTKGLDPTVPMKDSGVEWIGEIPTHWNTMRLRSKFSFGKGLPITKADLRDSGIGVISYGQIHSKYNIGTTIKPELIRYVDNMYLETNASSLVNNGDFIFADTSEDLSGCGNCVYVDTDYPLFAGYHTMILRSVENTSSKYYSYLFATDAWRSQIRAQASGVKLFSITQKMLRDALLIEPSEEAKASIVSFLDDMCSATDEIISSNEKTIKKLKEYRQSVIYEAVTGKVEI